MGQYYSVMNIVENMLQQDKDRAAGLKLFRKAWAAFPNERSYMLGSLHSDELWKLPEIYEYARQAVIPSDAVALRDPWDAPTNRLAIPATARSPDSSRASWKRPCAKIACRN